MADDWRDALRSMIPDLPQDSDSGPGPEEKPVPVMGAITLHVALERKGRAGKTATIVYGFPADYPEDELARVGSALRHRLGTGGSARGGEILLQGDRRADVMDALRMMGFKIKG